MTALRLTTTAAVSPRPSHPLTFTHQFPLEHTKWPSAVSRL